MRCGTLGAGLTFFLLWLCSSVGIAGRRRLVGVAAGRHVKHRGGTEHSGLHWVRAGRDTVNSDTHTHTSEPAQAEDRVVKQLLIGWIM